MTVLPTVRGQLQQAAQAQATRPAIPAWRRVSLVPLGLVLAIGVAVVAIVLLGRHHASTSAPATHPDQPRAVLEGGGIAGVRFGASARTAVTEIERALGLGLPAPASRANRIGYMHFGCGLDQTYWTGLPGRPGRFSHSAGLTLYFRHSRFAGYSYGPPWSYGPTTPIIRRGPRFTTVDGLGLDEAVQRAKQLYGGAFELKMVMQGTPPNPKLMRLPGWAVQTSSGRLYGWVESVGKAHTRRIGSISAGAVPNTPCGA